MTRLLYHFLAFFMTTGAFWLCNAQNALVCNPSAVPPLVKMEGITERIGDIQVDCTGGTPGTVITGNLGIFLPVNITNRINSNNVVTDVVFTVDTGSGPQPANVPGLLTGPRQISFNGLSFTLSPNGSAKLLIANIRAFVSQNALFPNTPIFATIGYNAAPLTTAQVNVGTPERGLFVGFSSKIFCGVHGSPLPDNTASLAAFAASNAVFNSTRITEGFADAFNTRFTWQSLNAQTGTRFIVHYGGFPAGAQIFVPDVIAGSDTIQPTAGGDFGVPASGGQHAPSAKGSLLLARVLFTDANGAGGVVVFFPGPPGSGLVSFDSMREVTLQNGSGFAVYEVVDSDKGAQESAQFPTFLGLAPNPNIATSTTEDVTFAPVSNVFTASTTDPIPRFLPLAAPPDCSIVGDCGAVYMPSLFVDTTPMNFTAQQFGNFQVAYTRVNNTGGGVLRWTVTIHYANGLGWLRVDPTDGVNNATIRVDAIPILAPGVYKATLTVDAGPIAGSRDIPITFTVTPPPGPAAQPPTISSIVNGATFANGPLAPGSLATVFGTGFSGASLTVAFDGIPAQVLFHNDTQANVLVPATLQSKVSTQVMVQAGGMNSAAQGLALAPFAPGIFKNGILNEDSSVNDPNHAARPGSAIQVFATGLTGIGAITAKVDDRVIDRLDYAGPAPGFMGVQQVNLRLPADLARSTANVSVCGSATSDQVVCSPAIQLTVAQ